MKNQEKVRKAKEYARQAHKGQKRTGGGDYIIHPLKVYDILKCVTDDTDILCAGLLHDVVEDSTITFDDIEEEFGVRAAEIVREVTNDRMGINHIKTKEGLIVKLADIIHNIHDNVLGEEYLKKKISFVEAYT